MERIDLEAAKRVQGDFCPRRWTTRAKKHSQIIAHLDHHHAQWWAEHAPKAIAELKELREEVDDLRVMRDVVLRMARLNEELRELAIPPEVL